VSELKAFQSSIPSNSLPVGPLLISLRARIKTNNCAGKEAADRQLCCEAAEAEEVLGALLFHPLFPSLHY
jgi:hypothetical protein